MQSPTKTESSGKFTRPANNSKALKEKFVEIYENFFKGNDPSAGQPHFWNELFLLKVNSAYLTRCLAEISQDQLLTIKACIGNINKIFLNAIEMMKDETTKRKINAIETLCVLLQGIFAKKFNNFSSDVINLLTGLNNANTVFTVIIKYEALRLAVVIVCGNSNINQNSINEFFMENDIFDPLIKIIIAPETSYVAYEAIMLLGILANYNKHESKNPYMTKITEIKDESVFQKILDVVASTCKKCRNHYIEIQDDDETYKYSVSSALSYIIPWGSTKEQPDITDPEQAFTIVAILLVFYDFVNNNKGFVIYISKSIAESETSLDGHSFLDFLSFASYLVQHNRSARTANYIKLLLFVMLILTEDVTFDSRISDGRKSFYVRLCRQRQPLLPSVKNPRPLVSYHWSELWHSLIGLLKFILSNYDNFQHDHSSINEILVPAINIINLCIAFGDSFFPDAGTYDKLIYEIVRSNEVFEGLYKIAIINANYDSLNLITPEKLDIYISYSEIPYHVPFVRQILRLVVEDFKRREILLD
ncbi:19693_t:CDS:10 [Gigaspora margarita]|uniref:19693_t:CDS:1 n=1 Tax=Gigaspora margarita TaxID=4874 RepID=A0ABN7VRN8_GIGMA|nr:19693_t:CDS:10 [Gigaspora margarita]